MNDSIFRLIGINSLLFLIIFILNIINIEIINGVKTLNCIPVAMAGYDVVHYFAIDYNTCNSKKGKKKYHYNLQSKDQNNETRVYQFWFSSQENLDTFSSNPWKYAPKFGGFCSYGTCCEKSGWPWEPKHLGPPAGPDKDNCGYRVYNGSLYFNIWNSYDNRFFKNAEDNIQAAEERWIGWFGSLHAGPFNWDCFSTYGWDYMDCVDQGQEYAPLLIDVESNGLKSCGVNPSGDTIEIIIIVSCCVAGCCLCCCLFCACRKYGWYKTIKTRIKHGNRLVAIGQEDKFRVLRRETTTDDDIAMHTVGGSDGSGNENDTDGTDSDHSSVGNENEGQNAGRTDVAIEQAKV